MRPILMAAILAVAANQASGQMCPGDVNLNGMTTVDEIVASVDSALHGCPAPLGCPLRFDEVTADDEGCFFVGRYHPLCGGSFLEATFFGDGEDLTISLFDPDIDFFADVVDDGIASLYAFQEITDPPQDAQAIEGEVLLSDPPREALTISPDEIPFVIDDCDFERYEGRFAEFVIFGAGVGGAATAVSRRADRVAAAKARLRTSKSDPQLSRLKREAALRRLGPVGTGRGAVIRLGTGARVSSH